MKLNRLHSITLTSLLALLLFTGCQDETDALPSEGRRTITLDLGIAMTRAGEGESDNTRPDNLELWVFDSNTADATRIFYENITDGLTFSIADLEGTLIQTIQRVFDVENEINTLHFYIVMNCNLGEEKTPADIEAATFTHGDWAGDNKVPIYGYNTLDVSQHRSQYSLNIDTKRAVGKLELFFTKESSASTLTINNLKLEHLPNIGYLNEEATQTGVTYTKTEDDILSAESIDVQTFLSAETALGDFSKHEENFTSLPLTCAYLLENPNGTAWTENNDADNAYTEDYDPAKQEDTDYEDGATRYKLTVSYKLGNTDKEQVIYLPAILRNERHKIFARVKDEEGTLEIQYKVLPWKKVESAIGYAPEPISTTDSPFSNETDFNNFLKDSHHYILLPVVAYSDKYSTTQALFNHLYENPNEGDNEARLCILTRPTYKTITEDKKFVDLKTGSAGARYYFMLTGPEGATWEAHLDNYEDFAFSNSENTDFSANEDAFGNDKVRMVTHGIARKKPYIIQIIATHLYTGYEPDMSGETTENDFDEDGFEHKNISENDWKDYFEDTYLTTWGYDKWKNEEVVETNFWITVKLKDGTEYELTINPSYKDDGNIPVSEFPFKEKRRFAGTDTRIWIRQIRAKYGIQDLEDLAKHDSNNWWQDNPYWSTVYEWGEGN